jgi:hypothetical protein
MVENGRQIWQHRHTADNKAPGSLPNTRGIASSPDANDPARLLDRHCEQGASQFRQVPVMLRDVRERRFPGYRNEAGSAHAVLRASSTLIRVAT